MSLFALPTEMVLQVDELTLLERPVEGAGGHQTFLLELRARVGIDGGLVLEDAELMKVARYAYRYGTGSYQDRFRVVLQAARRAGWVRA